MIDGWKRQQRGQGRAAEPDVIVIGAGVAGLYQLHRLRGLGLSVQVFEAGTDVGGTWYWNRYPGARFDSESWSYGYSFSEELLQEWEWPEHFAAQPDTLRYLNYVADKFDLRRDIRFGSRVVAARFDEASDRWTITLENGEQASARLLITALGPLSAPTLPNIPGRESFQGQAFHTSRWPREGVSLAGKRVGIIGTGATAIQVIQTIASEVGHLTVFQRTPNWAAPLHNRRITPEEQKKIKASYAEIFERCRQTSTCFIHQTDPRKALEVSAEEREAFWEKLYGEPGFGIWVGNFADVLTDKKANELASAFMAKKIRERVRDPRVADKLIPKDHGFGTRRLPLETRYFEVYNQDNVRLVDINETPIERITPQGLRTSAEDFAFDILIYATGFDGVTGPYDRIDIVGPGGRRLKDDWTGHAAHLPRHDGRGLSQHADGAGPAHRARQHPAQHRGDRRLADRPREVHARPRPVSASRRARKRWRHGSPRSSRRSRACCSARSTPGRPASTATSKAARCGACWATTAARSSTANAPATSRRAGIAN